MDTDNAQPGTRTSHFEEVSQRRLRDRAADVYQVLAEFASITSVNVDKLLGHIGRHFHFHQGREKATMLRDIRGK